LYFSRELCSHDDVTETEETDANSHDEAIFEGIVLHFCAHTFVPNYCFLMSHAHHHFLCVCTEFVEGLLAVSLIVEPSPHLSALARFERFLKQHFPVNKKKK
jgi:hypothetical protein